MIHILAGIMTLLQLLAPLHAPLTPQQRLRSGEWLRFHVVAQDDSAEMQRIKLCVRDAVQSCYAQNRPVDADMLCAAEALLPLLTDAAASAARKEGFTGEVAVILDTLPFDERELNGLLIPAGEYPALVIRMGDAQGRNWWGLLDPDTALTFAAIDGTADDAPRWDWSWQGLLAALLGLPAPSES